MEEHDNEYFEPVDVSEPREIRREQDVIDEALAIRRREWIKSHKSFFFVVIGVIIVGLIVFFIQMYFQNINPVRRFSASLYKDFSVPFRYSVSMTEDGENKMHYDGTIRIDRSKHTLDALYEADYNDYSFIGAATCDGNVATAGSFYQDRWTTHDCTEMVQNFFDFDADFRYGGFDCGAFMRFTGLTSDYSIKESAKLLSVIKKRLTTDSALATITTEKSQEGEHYHYDLNLYQLFDMVKEEGASVFYRSTDYDIFCKNFENNRGVLEQSKCTIDYYIDASGYMTMFDMNIAVQGKTYGLSCSMSDFGTAEVVLPEEFIKAVKAPLPTE